MKPLFECLTDELRYEIARQYKEAIGNLDNLPEKDAMAAMMVLVMVTPGAVDRLNADTAKRKEQDAQASQAEPEKPKKRGRGGRRKVKSDAEVDQIAGELLDSIDW